MYLQSLEMIGFKSFAPRTTLHFHRGVTAIVGPNGCGKSNVLDAIRWVLGEQSAKALRGGEMADVIFGGTDSRAPLGMAEVSMTFAECEKELGVEWNEVRITRRVFRDGKSEYFLNKAPCRLRDIHQLFMDTGVGRSAYSIMEQGKIDLILSSRPEDRRAIFEEAAGITKYKAQKKEALRKLDFTEANLLRVQDIIKEVNRQIGSLQRQAAKARRYQALMQDLRTFDTHLSYRNYTALRDELEAVRAELTAGEEARELHDREIAQQEMEVSEFRERIAGHEAEVAGLRDEIQQIQNRMFSAENRIATNAERVSEGRELVGRHQADIASAEEKILIQQNQIEETDQQIAAMIDSLRNREGELARQEENLRTARAERVAAESAIREVISEMSRLEARLSSLRGEITSAASRREAGDTRLRLLQGETEAAAAASAEIQLRLQEIIRRKQNAESGLESARAMQAAATHAYEAAQRGRQEAEHAYNAASKEAASLESRLEVLRQLQEQGEGFDEGTQAVLRGLDDPDLYRPAIAGALADQIRVESDLIPAIEAALGGSLQAIIFKDAQVASAAVGILSGKKLGRAAVIPREWIGSAPIFEGTLPEGAITWAANRVGGDGEGAIFARRLLAGVAVVPSLNEAFRLKSLHPALAFATLSGEFIDRNGVVRGGQSGDSAGHSALARKAQIEALHAELDAAIRRLEECTLARKAALEHLEVTQQELLESRESVQAAQVECATCDNEESLANRQRSDLEARHAGFVRETSQIEETLRASHARLTELETGIAAAVSELDTARERRTAAEASLEAARERETAAADGLNEIRVSVATSREQQESLSRQRGPMAARIAELTELLETRREEIANYERRINELENESAALRGSMAEMTIQRGELESRLSAAQEARDEVRHQSEALESALRAARAQLVTLQEQKGRLEVRAAQVEMRMENLRNHVSQRYQTDLEAFEPDSYALLTALRERNKRKAASEGIDPASPDASPAEETAAPLPSPEEGIPWERIEELVAEMTERLDSMGPVNLEAIQEFEELEQRQLFLEKQNADLVNSKVELLEVIARINRTTKELFSETFVKIRENFQTMFTELFGGGAANLILVDESDPLESGIEIIAKPPGKQLKSVSLLSGGERTMTAVALLFGIYMVKPSPFCVLDEMDAPLDESNISRFIKILDRFVDQSQFVVITHNKRTISRAEMLYGVTMEEHGVSKLVSVKFSGKKEDSSAPASVAEAFGKHGDLHSERSIASPEPDLADDPVTETMT